MLVLSRREMQRIFIGENIVITILRVAGNVVRVGLEAPDNVKILREEVSERSREDGEHRKPAA